MQMILTVLLAGLATYHETYNRPISMAAAASLATAPKYILFPEQRAKKVSPALGSVHRTRSSVSLSVCCYFP